MPLIYHIRAINNHINLLREDLNNHIRIKSPWNKWIETRLEEIEKHLKIVPPEQPNQFPSESKEK